MVGTCSSAQLPETTDSADDQDDWVKDISVAKAAGIDGFLLTIGTDGPAISLCRLTSQRI